MALTSYLKENVYEAALNRIRWVFNEFPNVVVNVSGGKDSTVVRNLALIVAEEMGRLPLKIYHCDLEAEWYTVIEYLRSVCADPRIEPLWLQIPMKESVFNATCSSSPYFYCWEPGKKWMREKEPIAIKENVYGVERYDTLFGAFDRVHYDGLPTARLAGIRTQESPARRMGLTSYETYKGVTWGSKASSKKNQHFSFYPIYDWGVKDVWKAIHDNGWPYCEIYDLQYRYGVTIPKMRISSLLHESAVQQLFYMQEVEPETWNRLVERTGGAHTAGSLQKNFFCPTTLPYMFSSWLEYRDYLLENLIGDVAIREKLRKQFSYADERFTADALPGLVKTQIQAILTHEFEGIKLSVFTAGNGRKMKNYGIRHRS